MKINPKAGKKTSFVLLKVRLIFIKTTWHLGLRFRTVKPENGLYYLEQNDGGLGETYSLQTMHGHLKQIFVWMDAMAIHSFL